MDLWSELFNSAANRHAPIKMRRVCGTSAPWMTSDLAKLMRDRDYCHRKARTSMSRRSWAAFHKINREVHLSMKKAKTDYYWKLIEENKGNCSKLWSSIKQFLHTTLSNSVTSIQNNVVYSTPQGIANALFFTNIGKMFSQKFTSTQSPTSSLQQAESSFHFFFLNLARFCNNRA